MAKISTDDGRVLYIPDEIMFDPNLTQDEKNAKAVAYAVYEQGLLNSKLAGGIAVAGEAFLAAIEEVCVHTGDDITRKLPVEFFSKHDDIFKKLFLSGMTPAGFLEIHGESMEEAYNNED